MTHVVHPYVHRIGIIRDWKSRWFGDKKKYKEFLKSDVLLREFLEKKLRDFYVSSIEMERDDKSLKVILKTSRPGMIIGRNGDGSKNLKDDILKFINKKKLVSAGEIKIDIEEIRSPESNAGIIAAMVREGLEKRLPFRRVIKQTIEKVMANRDVKGAKIIVSGRLGGAEMARKEEVKRGRIPLQTFRADVDFASDRAIMYYGSIGIKVWVYKGDIFDKSK
jgi:small subunit ribosomal protein S3